MNEINNDVIGNVHKLETFGLVDGPGVRFVVFLKDVQSDTEHTGRITVELLSAEENRFYRWNL